MPGVTLKKCKVQLKFPAGICVKFGKFESVANVTIVVAGPKGGIVDVTVCCEPPVGS